VSIRVVEPHQGEQSGRGPIRCRIIEDGSHTDHRVGLIEATMPAGTPHTFFNPFGEPAKFLRAMTPDLYVNYFRDLSALFLDEQGLLNPEDIAKTMAKYATDVIR